MIDPDNPHIVLAHLRAAIFELPLKVDGREAPLARAAPPLLDLLAEDRQIILRGRPLVLDGEEEYPADDFSLGTAQTTRTPSSTPPPDKTR